jgi:hypothetical protein
MNTMECPYCDGENEVEMDGDYGSAQDTLHEIECEYCKKNFVFLTEISFDFYPRKADCLNGSSHRLTDWAQVFPEFKRRRCLDCGWTEARKSPKTFSALLP